MKKIRIKKSDIATAKCESCKEPYHETLRSQWENGGRPRCGFCGQPLTLDEEAKRDETLYTGFD